jgi:hypothetical protein
MWHPVRARRMQERRHIEGDAPQINAELAALSA